jgi:hypothetical protein
VPMVTEWKQWTQRDERVEEFRQEMGEELKKSIIPSKVNHACFYLVPHFL